MIRTTPNTAKSIRIRPKEIKVMDRFLSSCIEDQTLKNQKQVFSQSNKKHNPQINTLNRKCQTPQKQLLLVLECLV